MPLNDIRMIEEMARAVAAVGQKAIGLRVASPVAAKHLKQVAEGMGAAFAALKAAHAATKAFEKAVAKPETSVKGTKT